MTPTPIPMQPEKTHQSIRLFENDLLERLSHVHPITPLLMWAPIAGWLIWRSFSLYQLPGLPVLAIALAGALSGHSANTACTASCFTSRRAARRANGWSSCFTATTTRTPRTKPAWLCPPPEPFPLWQCCTCCSAWSFRNPGFSRSVGLYHRLPDLRLYPLLHAPLPHEQSAGQVPEALPPEASLFR